MANPDSLVPFKQGDDPRRNIEGRHVGSKNRSTIARKWLELELQELNPITGETEKLSQEDIITLHQIKKAKTEADTNAYKALNDSAYGAPKQEIDQTNIVTLTNFTVKDIVDFEPDSEDTPE